jgi:hypothetical protein
MTIVLVTGSAGLIGSESARFFGDRLKEKLVHLLKLPHYFDKSKLPQLSVRLKL